jgi:hypothetical protein
LEHVGLAQIDPKDLGGDRRAVGAGLPRADRGLRPHIDAAVRALQWALVFIGVSGLGSVLYTAWKDTRDPAWRAAHKLPPLVAQARAPVAGTSPALAKAELQAGA